MGLLGNIAGNLLKNVFPKNTVVGKLLGSSRDPGTKTAKSNVTKALSKNNTATKSKLLDDISFTVEGGKKPNLLLYGAGVLILVGFIFYTLTNLGQKKKKR
jgi:hypothetical protein